MKLGWVGTWLPLLVPTFFANAFDVFLMRQYFMTIPTEMDEAAAIDGAGPFRTLSSVILPQAWPVVIAVAIFHLVYSWNDFFGPLIYLSTKPELQTLAVGLQRFNGIHYRDPGLIQAGTLMTLVIPVVVFLRLPAVLHPRHRHHRGREVTARRRRSGSRSRSTPSIPTGRPRPASRSGSSTRSRRPASARRSSSRAAGPRRTRRSRGPIADGGHLVGQPLALPCPDAAAHRRRAGRGHRRGRPGDPRRDRRRPAAVVPLPVRRRARTTRASCRR